MSASDSSTSRVARLTEKPAVAGYSVGDIVNVAGVLWVLTAVPRTRRFQGTAGSAVGGYVGTIVVDDKNESRVGAFADPAARGEVTWRRAANGQTAVRLRILRTAFDGKQPPQKLSVWIIAQLGGATKVTLNLVNDGEGANTTEYTWSTATGGAININAGAKFTALVSVNVDPPPSDVWKRWLGRELPKIDADTVTKRREIRDAINTETKLLAGPGIEIGVPNQEGKRTVAVANPKGIEGRAFGAADAFGQPALDQKKPWRVEAIEQGAPVFVTLKLDTKKSPPAYDNSDNPLRIDDTVTATIEYTRRSASGAAADAGKFIITTKPNSIARTLKDLFPNGTVTHFTIRLGATEAAAKLGRLITLPVEKVDSTDTLKMRTKRALVSDEEALLASATEVYVQVNFVVRDWRRDAESDLAADIVRASSLGAGVNIGDITSDGTSLFVVDRTTFRVVAFTNGKEDPSKTLDGAKVRAGIVGSGAIGLTTDGTNLYVLSNFSQLVAFTPNGERINGVEVPEGRSTASALTYDGSHLLAGGIRNRDDGVGDRPRVRPFTTDLVLERHITHHMGRPLENVDPNLFLKVGALAFGDGVLYVGNKNTGLVHAFVDGIRDETKEPPASMLTEPNMSGMTVHDGKLYVAVGQAVLAFVIPRDRYVFPEGYQFTTLDQEGLRKAAAARTIAVDKLPAPGIAGRQVWVKRDYVIDPGRMSVQPAAFIDTALEGLGYGERGWWRRDEHGHAIGSILGAFDELVLLSNNRVAIRTASIPGINKLHVGAAEYLLRPVSGEGNIKLTGAASERPVDVYQIEGGGLPSTGDWRDVWIEGAVSTEHYPATVTIEQGEYLDTGSAWSPAGFEAPTGDTEHDFRVLIQETVPGAAQAKEVEFGRQADSVSAAGPARYVATRVPFDYISSLEFDARSSSDDANRYLVGIPSDRAVGGGIPARIKVAALTYDLSVATVEDGVAVFRTPKVAASVRIDDDNPKRDIDVQYADGTWANGAGKQVIRTLDRPALQRAVNGVPEVTHLPRAPVLGQRVRLLVADHLARSGILKAGRATDGSALVGYRSDPVVGSLTETPGDDIDVLGNYGRGSYPLLYNGVFVARTVASGKEPQAVWINGRRYSVPTGEDPFYGRFWRVPNAPASTFVEGNEYRVQVQWTDGKKAYPDKPIGPDDYTWNPQQWMLTPGFRCVHAASIGADIGDSGDRGFGIANTSVATRSSFEAFSSSFDLDLVAAGALWSQLELKIVPTATTKSDTIGFDGNETLTYREGVMATVAAIKEQKVYTSGAVEGKGVVVAAAPIHSGADKLGDLRLYLAKNASDKLGYLFDYAPLSSQGSGKPLAVTAKLALSYQSFLAVPPAPEGAGP